jgi:tetratricopeptide (TPR) repeat protein
MSKKKKHQGKIAQSVTMLTANGLKAFRQNDLEKAILSWEKIPANLRPVVLLAEGHFRRGLALFYGPDAQAGLGHLETAAAYQPKDPCYAYHLGLAKHHLGDTSGALAAYQTVRQFTGPFAARAAYPLALALLQNDQNPAATPVWNDLTPAEQSMLRSASAFRRRPYHLPPESPHLWRSLAAFDAGDHSEALVGLDQVLAGNPTATEKGVAYYYQGVIAALAENWDTARRKWEAARMAGLRSPRLDNNLTEIYHRRAEELLLQGDDQTALAATLEAKRHSPCDSALGVLLAQIHQHLGYQAASANHWEEAQSHWQTAVELDSASFRLTYNLALAYERLGSYILAGQTWREALRRRPRRADHPDALNDSQVARLWQRAAQCYHQAGEFDEASHTYQQAIKWAPENLDVRLALAESLIRDGRLLSARNELECLLERSPNHIPALVRLGEAYFHDEDSPWHFKAQARKCWERALEIDPKNPQVCQMLAEWYFDQAEIDYSWDRYAEAAEDYQKSLEFRPNHLETMTYLAECYFQLKDEAKGEEYARQTLAQTATFDDFACIIGMWLRVEYYERAWEVTAQAESRFGKVPTDFYVSMAHQLLKNKQEEIALRWLQHAVTKATSEEGVLVMIGEMAMDVDVSLAKVYLQKALEEGQMPGQAHLIMGILEGRQDNRPASKKHFAKAEQIARQTKDTDLAKRVEMARVISSDDGWLLRYLMDFGGRGLLEEFSIDLNEDFDDD